MSSIIFRLKAFFTYWLDAVDRHSLHSPFLFDLYSHVLQERKDEPHWISESRKELQKNDSILEVTDYGAGSNKLKSTKRKIADIVQVSASPRRYSMLYANLIAHFQCKSIVELGTSVGLNTMYLATAQPHVIVHTFEGCPHIGSVARRLFDKHHLENINLHIGNLDEILHPALASLETVDFAFMDANHQYEPTLRYARMLMTKMHEDSILVIDDIHHSAGMQRAWEELKRYDNVYTSIDLYRCGLIFFKRSLIRQNAVLEF